MASNVLAGIAGGFDGLQRFLAFMEDRRRYQTEENRRRDREERETRESNARIEAHRASLETDRINRQLAQQRLDVLPQQTARDTLNTNIAVKGLEGTLDDPGTLNVAAKAGISLPHRPKFMAAPGVSQGDADAVNELMGVFPGSGIVKPPEVQRSEVERRLAINRAKAVQNILQGLTGAPGTTTPTFDENDPQARLRMRLGLGMNPNEVFGPIRETPEQAAARAEAIAKVLKPYQENLRNLPTTGDDIFDAVIRSLTTAIPPVNPRTQDTIVNAAKSFTEKAQAARPGSAPAAAPAPGPPQATPSAAPQPPQTMESLLLEAKKRFGSWEKVEEATSKPEVQEGLKRAGIDPAAYLLKIKAYKILERMEKGR